MRPSSSCRHARGGHWEAHQPPGLYVELCGIGGQAGEEVEEARSLEAAGRRARQDDRDRGLLQRCLRHVSRRDRGHICSSGGSPRYGGHSAPSAASAPPSADARGAAKSTARGGTPVLLLPRPRNELECALQDARSVVHDGVGAQLHPVRRESLEGDAAQPPGRLAGGQRGETRVLDSARRVIGCSRWRRKGPQRGVTERRGVFTHSCSHCGCTQRPEEAPGSICHRERLGLLLLLLLQGEAAPGVPSGLEPQAAGASRRSH